MEQLLDIVICSIIYIYFYAQLILINFITATDATQAPRTEQQRRIDVLVDELLDIEVAAIYLQLQVAQPGNEQIEELEVQEELQRVLRVYINIKFISIKLYLKRFFSFELQLKRNRDDQDSLHKSKICFEKFWKTYKKQDNSMKFSFNN